MTAPTLHFVTTFEGFAARAIERLTDFYGVDGATSEQSILSGIMSSRVLAPNPGVVRCYDGGESPGDRIPVMGAVGAPATAGDQLPGEVSICLSMVAGRNIPRKRGRIYIPAITARCADMPSTGDARPNSVTRTTLIEAASRLMVKGTTEAIAWVVYSPTGNIMTEVTGGWCDNAFDTQRRRGVSATSRAIYGTFTS